MSPTYTPPKTLRILYYLALHPGIIVFAMIAMLFWGMLDDFDRQIPLIQLIGSGLCCFGTFWAIVGFYPAWIIARYLCVLRVKVLRCPRCGFETDATGIWSSGGYNDHREQHVLLFRNPLDGARVSHLNCEMCDATILIQERWPLEQWWLP